MLTRYLPQPTGDLARGPLRRALLWVFRSTDRAMMARPGTGLPVGGNYQSWR